jgi:diacylglycerol O-acyltransferase / wax synthase
MPKQLTDQDVSFLYVETAETPGHVGGVSLVELPDGYRGNFFDDYKAVIAERMKLIPFMHSKLATVPFGLDRPFWIEDEHVDLDYHIRRVTVSAPGTMRELETLVALLHAHALDRTRPLWEFYVIEGLASGQPAIYTKMHHAAMDGATSQALIATMYDPSATPRVLAAPATDPASRGSRRNLVRGLLAHRARQAIRAIQFVPELLTACSHVLLPDPRTLRYRRIARVPRGPTTLLNVGITNQRAYAARTLPLSAIKQVAKLTATKVNDVVLAICSGALRGYLEDKRALPARSLTAMVPVLARDPADLQSPNQNLMLVCSLASDITDPYERLLAIARSSAEQKQLVELVKQFPLPDISLPGTASLVRWLVERYGRSRLAGRPPLLGNLCISNVPGPSAPLYIAGAKIASMYPCSMPFHGQALNITVESYCNRLDVGLVACPKALPDLAGLADRLVESFAELQQAVGRRCAAASPPPVVIEHPSPAVRDMTIANGKPRFTGAVA